MPITDDPNDPRLTHYTSPEKPGPQADVYLVLSEEERAKGFIRPVRKTYVHDKCGVATTMGLPLAETYARNPNFYGATYCCGCRAHFPVTEFKWEDGTTKIAALIMVKFGLDEVKITPDDIAKLVAGNVNIVLDARGERETGCLTLRIVDDKTAAKLVEDEKVEGN